MNMDMDMNMDALGENSVVGGKYKLVKKIGGGSFGEIYSCVNMENNRKYAVKIELPSDCRPQLLNEYKMYEQLDRGPGVPFFYYFSNEPTYSMLVMDMLGPSVEDLFNLCSRRFTNKTVLMLVDQMIDRIQFLHSKHIIHRDLKPNNFLIGNDFRNLFLIDFGLSKLYIYPRTKQHIPYSAEKSLVGTVRYSSLNTHLGIEQSRRDDMEAIGFIIIYLTCGRLPWQGVPGSTKAQRYEKIAEMKMSTSNVCSGLPNEYLLYLNYCRNLYFGELPEYGYLKQLFRTLGKRVNCKYDFEFDWIILKRNGNNNPILDGLLLESENRQNEEENKKNNNNNDGKADFRKKKN